MGLPPEKEHLSLMEECLELIKTLEHGPSCNIWSRRVYCTAECDCQVPALISSLEARLKAVNSFAYSTIEEYEELVGFKVNEAFRTGWMMARTMNSHIAALAESANKEVKG